MVQSPAGSCLREGSVLQHGRAVCRSSGLARAVREKGPSGPRGYSQRRRGEQAKRPKIRVLAAARVGQRRESRQNVRNRSRPPILRTDSLGRRALLVFSVSLAAIAALTTAISLFGFNVDLFIACLFYDPETKTFLAGKESQFSLLRDHGVIAMLTCAAFVALALRPPSRWRLPNVPGRAAAFLTLSLLLGPGLLVNIILKDNWGPAAARQRGRARRHPRLRALVGPARQLPEQLLVRVRRSGRHGMDVWTRRARAATLARRGDGGRRRFYADDERLAHRGGRALPHRCAVRRPDCARRFADRLQMVFGWPWAAFQNYLRRKRSTTSTAA